MFARSTTWLKRTKSTIVRKERDRLSGSKLGRDYNYAYRMYGPFGYGVGKNQSKKDRSAEIMPRYELKKATDDEPLSRVSRTLSKDWVAYALADGGVFYSHPSVSEVLSWSHETIKQERVAAGLYSTKDQERDATVKTILARGTLEAQPVQQWRKKHLVQLLNQQMRFRR